VSEATYELLPHEQWNPTGGVEVKGKVNLVFGAFSIVLTLQARCMRNKSEGTQACKYKPLTQIPYQQRHF
jgi:hypothetical protein